MMRWARYLLPAFVLAAVLAAASSAQSVQAVSTNQKLVQTFANTVHKIESLPYQANYVPVGFDSAFSGESTPVPNDAPVQDYTSGSIPGSPDSPAWPPNFKQVLLKSPDGARFYGELAMQPGPRPAVLVVHGFNTHGYQSVIRWAAMLAANGYDVLAADQRDFSFEYNNGNSPDYGYPKYPQTFGWKESQDVLAAGKYLRSQPGVASVGIVGFSEGAQNTVLAMAQDRGHVFRAGLTFSAPADQDTQIYSSAQPSGCQTPNCSYPSTDALVALVVPPYSYSDPCTPLSDAARVYKTTPYAILANESAMHAQLKVRVPLLNFYSADDSLVPPVEASLMAAFERDNPLHRTIEISKGEHAYFYDRWWQQMAILNYFHALLPNSSSTSVNATVNQTPAGQSFSSQEVAIPSPTPKQANGALAPYICETSLPPPSLHDTLHVKITGLKRHHGWHVQLAYGLGTTQLLTTDCAHISCSFITPHHVKLRLQGVSTGHSKPRVKYWLVRNYHKAVRRHGNPMFMRVRRATASVKAVFSH